MSEISGRKVFPIIRCSHSQIGLDPPAADERTELDAGPGKNRASLFRNIPGEVTGEACHSLQVKIKPAVQPPRGIKFKTAVYKFLIHGKNVVPTGALAEIMHRDPGHVHQGSTGSEFPLARLLGKSVQRSCGTHDQNRKEYFDFQ